MRALLAEPQQQMPNAGGDMRGFYEIGQPRDWWHWYFCEKYFRAQTAHFLRAGTQTFS